MIRSKRTAIIAVLLSTATGIFGLSSTLKAAVLFEEKFEDSNFSSRGWYDNPTLPLSSSEHISGSASSAEYRFLQGAATPASVGTFRKLFVETDEIYVSFYMKHSSNWTGSNRPYHPHEFLILTNKDGAWTGPSVTHMTAYIEDNEGTPLLALQDSLNIDETKINQDLTGTTEQRAVAGCNGSLSDGGVLDCYLAGSSHRNGKTWKAGGIYFSDTQGPYYKNDWHLVEAYFKMNSIASGIGQADGVVRYWYDGNPIIDHSNVIIRTGANADMKFNQFMIAPYIGDGSPVDQTFWVDDLTVGTSRPVQSAAAPARPRGLALR